MATDGPTRWRYGLGAGGAALTVSAVLLAGALARPGAVPNTVGRAGSLVETFLPWLGLLVPVLLVTALLRRSVAALCALLLPVTAWAGAFGGLALPASGPGGDLGDLTVVQHNVSDENPDPAGTARRLAATGAGLIALEELTPANLPDTAAVLAAEYPYHAIVGTVGLWSRHPLTEVRRVDIRPEDIGEGWDRGLRATARTPRGEVAVYVAHLPSVRIGPGGLRSARRDRSAELLGAALAAEPLERVILLGDLNGTVDDRGLAPLTGRLRPPATGFALSWPAALPLARIDQVLTRSAVATDIRTLPATGSDHLPVLVRVRL
ncbi:endonuclease/exonuclease/phosphatase family protein [Kitasatospora sp. NPDC004240]